MNSHYGFLFLFGFIFIFFIIFIIWVYLLIKDGCQIQNNTSSIDQTSFITESNPTLPRTITYHNPSHSTNQFISVNLTQQQELNQYFTPMPQSSNTVQNQNYFSPFQQNSPISQPIIQLNQIPQQELVPTNSHSSQPPIPTQHDDPPTYDEVMEQFKK